MNDLFVPIAFAVAPILVVLGWGVWSYNRFVSQRAGIDTAWAGVDVQLQRRHDLIPNLVETVQGYADHERDVLERVTIARAAAVQADRSSDVGPGEQAIVEDQLAGQVRQLMAVAESYPDLRAEPLFRDLQSQLTETEDRIAASRRLYNLNVRDHNERVQQVPSNLIARWFDFEARQYFDATADVATVPTVGK